MITMGAFFSMSFLGMSRTFVGTALPEIRSSLNLTILQAGTLTALLQLGFSTAVFLGGPISDLFKKKVILMLGCLLLGSDLILFGFSAWFWLNFVGIVFIGIGGGLIESSSNPLLVQLFPGRESVVMNLHHFFFALGSLSGPLIMGAVLAKSIPWQWGFIGFGMFVLVIFLFILFQRSPTQKKRNGFDMRVIGRFMTEKTFLSLFFIMLCNSGIQNGICFWMVSFLKETRGFSVTLASSSLFLFFSAVAVGRLFTSHLITRIHEAYYLSFLFSLLFLTVLFSTFAPGKWAIVSFILCGFGHSGVYPCTLGMAGKLYPNMPGSAMGILATGGGLGAVFVPWLMSLVSQLTNLKVGFLSLSVFAIFALFLIVVQSRNLRSLIPLSPPIPSRQVL